MKEIRSSFGETEVQLSSLRIQRFVLGLDVVRRAETVLVYVSIGREIQTRTLLKDLLAQGKRVAVPQILDRQVEACEILEGCGWETGPFGLPVPRSSFPLSGPLNVCIVPGLAFSIRCDRLGFGFGHWDRFFGRTQVDTVIGVCHDRQILPSIPIEKTDRPADLVVTGERLLSRDGVVRSIL